MGIMTNSWAALPNKLEPKHQQVGGHEGVGVVVKLGEGSDKSAIKVGQRVGIKVSRILTTRKTSMLIANSRIVGSIRLWLL